MAEMKTRCDGITIRFRVEGDGDPVTLVHGVGSNLESWDRVARRLTPEYLVIRMDLRGHGRSDRITRACALEAFVSDLVGVLDEAGIQRTDLVGFSLGGMIAQSLALARPKRVHRLALISAVAGRTPEERRKLSERARKVREHGVGSVLDAADRRWFTDGFRKQHPEQVKKRLEELLENDPASYAEAYRVFAESDVGDRIHQIRHRTLVVTGEHDVGSSPRMARFMHQRIGGAKLVILSDLKHSVLVEAPDTIADLLLDFLTTADGAPLKASYGS